VQCWRAPLGANLACSGGNTLVAGEPAILTEGEFDALLWQEAGDLVGVATLGSCKGA
jgi:hypothetical protein